MTDDRRAAAGGVDAAGHPPADEHRIVTCAKIVRRHLSQGSGEEQLTRVAEEVARVFGCDAMAVVCHKDGDLVLEAGVGYPSGSPGSPGRMSADVGIAGWAFRTGQPAITFDSADDDRWADLSQGSYRSGIAIPLGIPGRIMGVLVAESSVTNGFTEEDIQVLQPVADQLAWAMDRVGLQQETLERAQREERLRRGLEATATVITAGLGEPNLADALEAMVREIRDQLRWDRVRVLLNDGKAVRLAASHGLGTGELGPVVPAQGGLIGRVLVTGVAMIAGPGDTTEDGVRAREMCAPLKVAGVVRGALHVSHESTEPFNDDDLSVLRRLSQQMSLVMHNSELLASEKDTVAKLHELDQMRSRLLTTASHELRTPLTVVLGFAEVLAGNAADLDRDRIRDYAVAIERQASSLGQLVDQMLLAAQIEHGTITVLPSPCALIDLVRQASAEYTETIEIGSGVAGTRVLADPFRLTQVLTNLFGNAVKYASDGRIQIQARVDSGTVTILLRDEGPGIPASEQQRVFDPFHQFGEHGVAGRRGVGLGLTVSRDLVRLMGGELQLASAEGYGVTFTITLPAP